MAQNECEILKKLDHQNIVKVYEMCHDEKNNEFCLVQEFVPGTTLFHEVVKREEFTELVAAKIVKQILQAVNYLHHRKICHNDIKADNIILSEAADVGGD